MRWVGEKRWRALRAIGLAVVSFLFLFLGQYQAQHLWIRGWFEWLGQAWHALSFWICFPAFFLLYSSPLRGTSYETKMALSALITIVIVFVCWIVVLAGRKAKARWPRVWKSDSGEEEVPTPRRNFIRKSAVATVGILIAGPVAYGSVVEPNCVRITRRVVPVKGLPLSLDGLKILQYTDTHYGPFVRLGHIERAIALGNKLNPDLVLLTGDYVHQTSRAIRDGVGVFQGIKSRLGTLAVLGNHDHWESTKKSRRRFAEIGIPLIDNDRRFLTANGLSDMPGDEAICIGGVGDMWTDDVLYEQALDGVPETMPRLVLSHNPDTAETLSKNLRVDAIFSGHTHGGQVLIPGIPAICPSDFGTKYLYGLCEGPYCPVHVSCGVGMGVVPARFRCMPEINVYTLKRGK